MGKSKAEAQICAVNIGLLYRSAVMLIFPTLCFIMGASGTYAGERSSIFAKSSMSSYLCVTVLFGTEHAGAAAASEARDSGNTAATMGT